LVAGGRGSRSVFTRRFFDGISATNRAPFLDGDDAYSAVEITTALPVGF